MGSSSSIDRGYALLVAGVDSSTQSCKVMIRDAGTGAVVRSGRAAHPPGSEVDPESWWLALWAAIQDAGGLDDVSAISIAAQEHGLVALDGDGRVIRPALLWNDTGSAAAAVELGDEVGAAEYARRAGSVPVASFTASKLRWLRDAEPGNAARVAAIALPHDWLTWRLCGYGPSREGPLGPVLDALTTDRSDASGTGYWNPAAGRYDFDLFRLAFGRPGREATGPGTETAGGEAAPVILPRVLAPAESAGSTPAGILVAAGAGDNAAAALGLGAGPGDVVVSLGTSGTVFAINPTAVADPSGSVVGFADASGSFLPLVATLNAARALDTIAELLGVDHEQLGQLALSAPPGSQGLVLVPWFEGERTPNRPDATATLGGMTLASTSRTNLARATVEGMLCGLATGLDVIRELGVSASRLLLIGGSAQNAAVSTIAAQIFDARICVPEPAEYVAAGAAVQAAWALTGEYPDWTIALADRPAADHNPIIREQYAKATARL